MTTWCPSDQDDWPPDDVTLRDPEATAVLFHGYGSGSDERVPLACSECGERVEVVDNDGFICGCRETPAFFVAEPMDGGE